MKRGLILFLIVILLISVVSSFGDFEGEVDETNPEIEDARAESVIYNAEEIPNKEWAIEESQGTQTINTQEQTTQYIEVQGTTSPTTTWNTNQGSFSNYQLTNALFTLGTLAQASLISFDNNNNIFFSSIFDSSIFEMILDNEGEASIAQRNSMGDTGKVYIQMDSGNLTQDSTIIFIPAGNNPTYIYNNESSVEFEDGTVYYQDEYITNPDNTEETTTFDITENGIDNLNLVKDAEYGFDKYKIKNTNREGYLICKDAECDIEVSEERLKAKGKVELYFEDLPIYESFDSNNIGVLENELFSLTNVNPKNELKAVLYSGHHVISEADKRTSAVVEEEYPYVIREYTSSWFNETLEIDNNGDLIQGNIKVYVNRDCTIEDIGIVCPGSLIALTND
ncbi:MAG: hypothetical protein ABIJ18_05690 [archaeon]